jgi:hypothetical protein
MNFEQLSSIAGKAESFADLLCKSLDFCEAKMQIDWNNQFAFNFFYKN